MRRPLEILVGMVLVYGGLRVLWEVALMSYRKRRR